eukprot:TRINITY_DN5997_c0_g2_i1.p1 TRINITY_DN5997_c0_g2~~TRINITY_DN5997_c0_g2_i1.p1  ORF type:complete len:331 (-),score=89.14 TRINITY_DN5997_c0_g2_i1:1045-2037(-)
MAAASVVALPRGWTLHGELLGVWRQALADLPVAKDLPRLAGRVVVETYDASTEERRERRKAQGHVLSIRLVEPPLDAPESESAANEGSLELLPKSLRDSDKLQVLPDDESEPSSFASHSSSLSQEVEVSEQAAAAIVEEADSPAFRRLKDIRRVVCDVSDYLERAEVTVQVNKFFDKTLKRLGTKPPSDLEYIIGELFTEVVDPDGKLARVFKAIHQNIIFCGVYAVKAKLPLLTKQLTKDVNTPEGWRIRVFFNNNQVITISHTKRETSCDPRNNFWFEWEITMTFDAGMNDMQAASLKITQLHFGTPITEEVKAAIHSGMCGGSILLA